MSVLRYGLYSDGLTSPVIIWGLLDGKAGHANQIHGLIKALERLIPIEPYFIDLRNTRVSFSRFIIGRFPAPEGATAPDLIIGAGHATHLPLLAAKRHHGGKTVVLMKPSLPTWLFDLCIIPQHDQVRENRHVLNSMGPLNSLQPAPCKERHHGIFLIGGRSRHYTWDSDKILEQIDTITKADPEREWALLTSRRTPDSFILKNLQPGNDRIRVLTPKECLPQTFSELLSEAEIVWVTPDSISMVYEALSAGAAVGLFELEEKRKTCANSGINMLAEKGWCTPYVIWKKTRLLHKPEHPLAEADRIAHEIVERWHLKRD
ncbi:MAG: hypothetical protein D6698_10030 [Gammaproteobacteria bacterium]|nr:MAG: hypothetical protein D6698_10030 [Gammaproteobacteria bacterium]